MTIPFDPILFGIPLNIQVISECLAFSVAFRYYVVQRKYITGDVSGNYRMPIIWGAILGTFFGTRLIGALENPYAIHHLRQVMLQFNGRNIMGGIFGALLGVQVARRITNEKHLSLDLFTLPLILGIFIGRIGSFLDGTRHFTYGSVTDFFMAMDLGDGLYRHPIALYELFFLVLLYIGLHRNRHVLRTWPGLMLQIFMLSYYSFRFCIEFVKPNVFFIWHLSGVQWLSVACWVYYLPALWIQWRQSRIKTPVLRLEL